MYAPFSNSKLGALLLLAQTTLKPANMFMLKSVCLLPTSHRPGDHTQQEVAHRMSQHPGKDSSHSPAPTSSSELHSSREASTPFPTTPSPTHPSGAPPDTRHASHLSHQNRNAHLLDCNEEDEDFSDLGYDLPLDGDGNRTSPSPHAAGSAPSLSFHPNVRPQHPLPPISFTQLPQARETIQVQQPGNSEGPAQRQDRHPTSKQDTC